MTDLVQLVGNSLFSEEIEGFLRRFEIDIRVLAGNFFGFDFNVFAHVAVLTDFGFLAMRLRIAGPYDCARLAIWFPASLT